MSMSILKFHEVANIFPMMSDEEYAELKDDIAARGLLQPIWTWQGKIIDGRNRYKACQELGIKPQIEEWDGRGSLVSFVVSLNVRRRHLTSGQKAACAALALPIYEAEAQARQIKLAGTRPNKKQDLTQKIEEGAKGEATEQAARDFGTNRQYVSDAKKLLAESPKIFEQVKRGELSMTQSKREYIKEYAPPAPQMPTGRYRVIYADPPWKYGNTQPDYHTEQADHYRLMTIAELCAMPIQDIAEDNAVLFMWATSPILEECFAVIKAWGFKYKSSFVWDKIKHNMGHYNSVRHEFLLICTRGSCQPDVQKLFDSVISEERTEHSKKPETFRTIIDAIYPKGKRIELFARNTAKDWEAYGNELS